MQIYQRFQQLAGPADQFRLSGQLPSGNQLVQTLPLDVVHDGVNNAVLLNKIIDLRDISVAESL